MTIDEKIREGEIREIWGRWAAPTKEFIVCAWDPTNPGQSKPRPVAGPYTVLNFAKAYAARMNSKEREKTEQRQKSRTPWIGETEYIVVNDVGYRTT